MITATPFAIIPEWVLDAEINPRTVVLYGILRRHRTRLICSPGRQSLAKRLRCDLKTIDRLTKELVAVGALTVRPRKAKVGDPTSNDYVLLTPSRCPQSSPMDVPTPLPMDVATKGNERKSLNESSVPNGTGPAASGAEPDAMLQQLLAYFVDTARRRLRPHRATKKALAGHLARLRDKTTNHRRSSAWRSTPWPPKGSPRAGSTSSCVTPSGNWRGRGTAMGRFGTDDDTPPRPSAGATVERMESSQAMDKSKPT